MKTHKKLVSNVIFASLMLTSFTALSGCGNVKQTMGLDVPPPDEFTVITRPPLELPPNFELRAPVAGAIASRKNDASQAARNAMVSNGSKESHTPAYRSSGENAFVKSAGIDKAEPNIRETIEKETSSLIKQQDNFADKLIFWKDGEHDPTQVIVDAEKEKQRIDENNALGKPLNEGKVPTVEKKKEAPLEGMF